MSGIAPSINLSLAVQVLWVSSTAILSIIVASICIHYGASYITRSVCNSVVPVITTAGIIVLQTHLIL